MGYITSSLPALNVTQVKVVAVRRNNFRVQLRVRKRTEFAVNCARGVDQGWATRFPDAQELQRGLEKAAKR